MPSLAVSTLESPIGGIKIHCSDSGVRKLEIRWNRESVQFGEFGKNRKSVKPSGATVQANKGRTSATRIAALAARELKEYFAGQRRNFSVPMDVEGTPFQKKVWKALNGIPYGEVISYGQIARRIGNAKASRAVGTANGANPVAIIVPCHRVIAGDGTLGGYGGGLTNKSYLLTLEQSASKS
ncbi:MAG: methylated-DNA--[protein]-cysteine S-methyltransferase [Acidobacteria bacterium]|nr:methylated-DNA--[protein]-cysteine S-methyltransferase [Acidobacteriota bacterium]